MNISVSSATIARAKYGAAFWERLWRLSGINFVLFIAAAWAVYGLQPPAGAPADMLIAFYGGARTRILIAAILSGMAVLNLLWFAAAIRTALADAGRDGWGGAVTAASAMTGGLFLLLVTLGAALAHGGGADALLSGLNDLSWAGLVLSAFPRAMLIMAATFGFWRAGLISDRVFGLGVVAVVATLLGGTTWFGDGAWAPDGIYSRFVSPVIGLLWVLAASRIVLVRAPGRGW